MTSTALAEVDPECRQQADFPGREFRSRAERALARGHVRAGEHDAVARRECGTGQYLLPFAVGSLDHHHGVGSVGDDRAGRYLGTLPRADSHVRYRAGVDLADEWVVVEEDSEGIAEGATVAVQDWEHHV